MSRTKSQVSTVVPVQAEEMGSSQTVKAIIGLRGLILQGTLRPGERVMEQVVAEHLGVSRTPARAAIARVCEEGLIDALRGSGYVVATYSPADVFDAITIRGNLEGMAARLAAEKGAPLSTLQKLDRCVLKLDEVLRELAGKSDVTAYVMLNDEFHDLLLDAAQSPMLRKSLQRVVSLPFAAPNCFMSMGEDGPAENYQLMLYAQEQHRSLVEAIRRREGARAEALAQEHARTAWKFLDTLMKANGGELPFGTVPVSANSTSLTAMPV